jgi:hypothetical protein
MRIGMSTVYAPARFDSGRRFVASALEKYTPIQDFVDCLSFSLTIR